MRVLIVGGGPAGMTLAWWLAKGGCQVVISERGEHFKRSGYILNALGQCLDIMRGMGMARLLEKERLNLTRTVSLNLDGSIHHERDLSIVTDGTKGLAIHRADLQEAMYSIVQQVSGITFRFGTTVNRLQENDAAVTVDFSDGMQAAFDVVVGADGTHSHTRRMLFGNAGEQELALTYIGFTVPNLWDLPFTRYELMTAGATALVSPTNQRDLIGVLFTRLPSDSISQNPKGTLLNLTRTWGWKFHEMVNAVPHSDAIFYDTLTQVNIPTWSQGRCVLLGDAAYCMSPLSGRGVDGAVTGAYILATHLLRTPHDISAAFNAYERQLRPGVERVQKQAAGRVGMSAPQAEWKARITRTMMARMPRPLMRRMIEREFANKLVPDLSVL
ncbi:MAG: FAD-dependent monooxygenase [Chloroflexota bacterium]